MNSFSLKNYILSLFCLVSIQLFAQNKEIEGTVMDANSKTALAFVNILLNGSNSGFSSDIDGKFNATINENTDFLLFTSIGYEKKKVPIAEMQKGIKIYLKPITIEIAEVKVVPGINPADIIMQKVIDNKDKNNPEKATEFSYDSYNKLVFTINPDSLAMKLEAQKDSEEVDSSLLWTAELVNKQHIFMMESVSHRDYISPERDKEVILASRVSGLKNPEFSLIGTQLQSFSFYNEYVELMDYKLLSPISKVGVNSYLFILEDSIIEDGEKYYLISFQQKNGKNFNALKGQLTIHKGDWAIKNVIGEPKESGGFEIKIQQLYEKVDGQWFPIQLNSNITFNGIMIDNFPLYGIGRSYLKNIELRSQRDKRDFDNVVLELDRKIKQNTDSLLAQFRIDSLDIKDVNTYHTMDSIGEAEKLDEKLKLFRILATGKIPLGFVNIDLGSLMAFNNYEGFRLGIGAETNYKVSEYFKFSGYYAYGFKDTHSKYGATVSLRPSLKEETVFSLSYQDDVRERGQQAFVNEGVKLFSTESFKNFYIYQMDQIQKLEFKSEFRIFRYFKTSLFANKQFFKLTDNYHFKVPIAENTNLIYSNFQLTELGISGRFSYGEKLMEIFGSKVSLGTKYPIVYFKYAKGLLDADGDFEYNKFDVRIDKTFTIRNAGETSVRLQGGMIDAPLPITYNYTASGVNKGFPIEVANSFNTAKPNEFFHNRYTQLFVSHNFQSYLYKGEKFQPQLALHTAIGFGDFNQNTFIHQGLSFKSMEKGFYESGLSINNLLSGGITQLGIGAFYKYGYYAAPQFKNNIVLKLSLKIGF